MKFYKSLAPPGTLSERKLKCIKSAIGDGIFALYNEVGIRDVHMIFCFLADFCVLRGGLSDVSRCTCSHARTSENGHSLSLQWHR
jgi:hypothetical protein